MPKLRIEESAAKRQARIDSGNETIVGVNKYKLQDEQSIDILQIDNTKVRQSQIEKLNKIRSTRDEAACSAALDNVTNACTSGENLLGACVEAARLRATLGEISSAMEKVFGRHKAADRLVSGAYKTEFGGEEEINQVGCHI